MTLWKGHHLLQPSANDHSIQPTAMTECVLLNHPDSVRYINLVQKRAHEKCIHPDLLQILIEYHNPQIRVTTECVIVKHTPSGRWKDSDMSHIVRNHLIPPRMIDKVIDRGIIVRCLSPEPQPRWHYKILSRYFSLGEC